MAGSDRARDALPVALELVGHVRDGDSRAVQRILETDDVVALCVILAALVDDTRRPSDLLAWAQPRDDLAGWSWPAVLVAHREYERHRAAGTLDALSAHHREGQRLYDRLKARERRGRARQAADTRAQLARTLGISA